MRNKTYSTQSRARAKIVHLYLLVEYNTSLDFITIKRVSLIPVATRALKKHLGTHTHTHQYYKF